MSIKVYISSTSGNNRIKKNQQLLRLILDGKRIKYTEIDISFINNAEEKQTMLEMLKKNDKTNLNLPVIFLDDEYIGDFEDVYTANELEEVELFMRVPGAAEKKKEREDLEKKVIEDKENEGKAPLPENDEDKENVDKTVNVKDENAHTSGDEDSKSDDKKEKVAEDNDKDKKIEDDNQGKEQSEKDVVEMESDEKKFEEVDENKKEAPVSGVEEKVEDSEEAAEDFTLILDEENDTNTDETKEKPEKTEKTEDSEKKTEAAFENTEKTEEKKTEDDLEKKDGDEEADFAIILDEDDDESDKK